MAITLVNNNYTTSTLGPSPSSISATVTAATSGNVLILALMVPKAGTISSLALTNVTWTLASSVASNGLYELYIYYGIVSGTGGTSLTFTVTGASSGQPCSIQMSEWSGLSTSTVVDGSPVTNAQALQTGISETTSTGSLTTGTAGDLVIAFMCADGSAGSGYSASGSPGNSFTSISTTNSGGAAIIATQLAYQIESSTGTYSSSQAFSGGSSQNFYCTSIILGFLAATGGGGGAVRRRCWVSMS